MAGAAREPRRVPQPDGGGSQGPATDSQNVPVIDPTQNVLDLVEAAIARQDDLRTAEADHIRELLELRGKRFDHDYRRLEEVSDLRARHAQELRQIESNRLNDIRKVDVDAVQRAAEVQATQASALAQQVAVSAETLRTQVAAAAQAAQVALAAALEPIIKDIADLRRAQYEAQGQKTQVVEGQAGSNVMAVWLGVGIAALSIVVAVSSIIIVLLTTSP